MSAGRKKASKSKRPRRLALLVAAIRLVVVARSQIVEACVSGFESDLDLAGGSVALFCDDELGDSAMIGFGLVVVVAKNEDDVVGVLLDGARFTQIGQLRALVFGSSRFDGAVQLRQSNHRYPQLFRQA